MFITFASNRVLVLSEDKEESKMVCDLFPNELVLTSSGWLPLSKRIYSTVICTSRVIEDGEILYFESSSLLPEGQSISRTDLLGKKIVRYTLYFPGEGIPFLIDSRGEKRVLFSKVKGQIINCGELSTEKG